jgi:hypothetical protein
MDNRATTGDYQRAIIRPNKGRTQSVMDNRATTGDYQRAIIQPNKGRTDAVPPNVWLCNQSVSVSSSYNAPLIVR